MMDFVINDFYWKISFVPNFSDKLMRSDGTFTVGVTDLASQTVFLSENLRGTFLRKVICHEIVHCAMYSYGIDLTIDQEEVIADLIATYGDEIISITDTIFDRLRRKTA